MIISHISREAWQKFEERYPGAYAFLVSASLEGELAALKIELERIEKNGTTFPGRIEWVKNRIEELSR